METAKIRNSNMELLRILAMMMVVIYHISRHCVMNQLFDGNNVFCQPEFYNRLFLIEAVMPFGMIANAVFVLISGYFMIEKGENIKLGKTAEKLLFQLGFAAVLMIVITTIYYRVNSVDLNTAMVFVSISDFNTMSWFVGYYFAVITIAYIFLNKYLVRLEKNRYVNLLLGLIALFSFGWSGQLLDGISNGFRLLVCGVFLYALGGYIKKYDPFERIRTWILLILIIVLYFMIYVSYYNNVQSAIHSYLAGGAAEQFSQPLIGFENYEIVPVIIAVVLLELFKRLSFPDSQLINYIGASTFMIYLFHDNEFWWNIWSVNDWMELLEKDVALYVGYTLKWTFTMFFMGLIVYTLYNIIIKMLKLAWRNFKCLKTMDN